MKGSVFGDLFRDSDSGSDDENPNKDTFSLDEIRLVHDELNPTIVKSAIMLYSFENRVKFESILVLDGVQRSHLSLPLTDQALQRLVLDVALCVLPWYWMGFGCRRVLLRASAGRLCQQECDFWSDLYSNVLLEYMYIHKERIKVRSLQLEAEDLCEGHDSDVEADDAINGGMRECDAGPLIPLGGIAIEIR